MICGSMFSGKTEELLRRIKRAKYANQRFEIFKPEIDIRYDLEKVTSHDENSIQSTPVQSSSQILLLAGDVDIVALDEAQFFDSEIVTVCNTLAERGIRVIVAGLDMDYLGVPFGPMPALIATAEYVTKVHAICMVDEDLPLLQQQLGAKTKAFHQTLTEARRIISRQPEQQRQLEDVDRDLAAMATLNLPQPATVAAALPESADLARVVMTTKRTKVKAPVSDADAYLRMQQAQQAMAADEED